MGKKFGDSFPPRQRFFFEMAETERALLERHLQTDTEKLAKLEENLRDAGITPSQIRRMQMHSNNVASVPD